MHQLPGVALAFFLAAAVAVCAADAVKSVALSETPPARKTIREQIGGGKILRIDRSLFEKQAGVLPYEVEGRKDGRPFDFSVGPHGKFLGMDD